MESKNTMSVKTKKTQAETDQHNAAFWDVLCGSQLATQLGIKDDSKESLKKFDDWYFEFYPYLYTHIPFDEMQGKKVLDVGLGYGTVAQKIAESGAHYHGLDIAKGPVDMANLRIKRNKLKGKAVQASVLDAPFEDEYFDWAIAIGCLHHTGNLTAAIKEIYRVLKPGGSAMIMVYNATSYRQFQENFFGTLARVFSKPKSLLEIGATSGNQKSRGAYDTNNDGDAAPQTEFVTKKELALMCKDFSSCTITAENIGEDGIFRKMPREKALKFGNRLGLDLYCRLEK